MLGILPQFNIIGKHFKNRVPKLCKPIIIHVIFYVFAFNDFENVLKVQSMHCVKFEIIL